MRSWNCPFTSLQMVTGHQTSCTLDFFFFVSISLAFLQRLLTWDADSCSIHLSTSLVNTFSSMMSAAWTSYRSLLLPLVAGSRWTCACTGGCSALALALWLIPLCPATGRCPPPLSLGLTLCCLQSPPFFYATYLFKRWEEVELFV